MKASATAAAAVGALAANLLRESDSGVYGDASAATKRLEAWFRRELMVCIYVM